MTCAVIRPQPKPTPRIVGQIRRKKDREAHEREIKVSVRLRDRGRCRVCGKPATEVHEMKFKSLGGVVSMQNSIAVCAWPTGNCHALLQQGVLEPVGTDADRALGFRRVRETKVI